MIEWNEDQQSLRDAVLEKEPDLSEGHIDDDATGEFAHTKWKLVSDLGLLSLPFPAEYGGLDCDMTTTLGVIEALGYACRDGGLGFVACTTIASTGVSMLEFGSDELKSRYLPGICDGSIIGAHAITEPEGGSDALAMATTAKPAEDDPDVFVLSGSKCFVSNAPIADVIVVYAKTHERGGPLGITAFAVDVDTPGLDIGPPASKMGLCTAPLSDVFLDEVRVPRSSIVGRLGGGYRVLDFVMKREILLSFGFNLGEMDHRLGVCVDYVKTRKQFGQNIGSFQSVANRIVKMKIAVETGRKWLYDTAKALEAGEDITSDLAITKLIISEGNVASGLHAVQIFGGSGYMTEMGLEKDLRNAVGGTIYSGTTEIQYNRISSILGIN